MPVIIPRLKRWVINPLVQDLDGKWLPLVSTLADPGRPAINRPPTIQASKNQDRQVRLTGDFQGNAQTRLFFRRTSARRVQVSRDAIHWEPLQTLESTIILGEGLTLEIDNPEIGRMYEFRALPTQTVKKSYNHVSFADRSRLAWGLSLVAGNDLTGLDGDERIINLLGWDYREPGMMLRTPLALGWDADQLQAVQRRCLQWAAGDRELPPELGPDKPICNFVDHLARQFWEPPRSSEMLVS